MIQLKSNQRGVTILELMIATVIFATILLILMSGFVFVTKDYQKAFIESEVQNTTRAIMQQVAQQIELSSSLVTVYVPGAGYPLIPSGSANGMCIGGFRYSFVLNQEIGTGAGDVTHALVADNVANCKEKSTSAQNISGVLLSNTSKELLSNGMRLGYFTVTATSVPGLYKIDLEVAYGDAAGSPQYGPVNVAVSGPYKYGYSCNNIRFGGSFCAVSSLSSYAQTRVYNQTQ